MNDINKFSAPFKEMAERVEKIDPKEFSGAILVVPKDGDPIAMMIADPSGDQEAFWATALSKVQIRVSELMATKNQQAGYGRR